jgi:hypothetical protein
VAPKINKAIKFVPDTYSQSRHPRNGSRSGVKYGRVEFPVEIVESVSDVREVNNMETIVAPGTHFNPGEFLRRVRIHIEIYTLDTIVHIDSVGR